MIGVAASLTGVLRGVTRQPRLLGGNVPVNQAAADLREISAHNSPTVVRNPADPGNLALANRIDTPLFSCALHISFDGGATWQQTPIPAPAGRGEKCFAPDVAFGADGTLYLTFTTLADRGNLPTAIWFAVSDDGGRTLSPPEEILGPLAFQVRLVADPEIAGRLYMTWLHGRETVSYGLADSGAPIRFARSDDGGKTWRGGVQVNDDSYLRPVAATAAIGPRGEIYVVYLDLGDDTLDYTGAHAGQGGPPFPGAWKLLVARSLDGGVSWETFVVDDEIAPIERVIVFIPPYPSSAVDQSSGDVYIAWHDARTGDADILFWASRDGAETWTPPTQVNDNPARDESWQYLPKLAVAPGGRIDIVYYDRRDDPANVLNDVSLQSSSDGGDTFGDRVRLTDEDCGLTPESSGCFDSRIGFGSERDLPDLGSRLGLVSTEDRALAVWTDTRAGTVASNKQDIVQQVVVFRGASGFSGTTKDLLRWGGMALALAGVLLLVSWVAGIRLQPAGATES